MSILPTLVSFSVCLPLPRCTGTGKRRPPPPAQRLETVCPTASLDAGRSLFMGRLVARLAKLARGAGHRPADGRHSLNRIVPLRVVQSWVVPENCVGVFE